MKSKLFHNPNLIFFPFAQYQKLVENNPNYINVALKLGYEVEVDVRFENGKFFLGHDFSQYHIDNEFLLNSKIWCHAKTKEALEALEKIKAH